MKILISGATGFIGRSLVPLLLGFGYQLHAVVRQIDNRLASNVKQYTIDNLTTLVEPMDIFINLAGEGIADKPWTEKRRKILYTSRVELTKKIYNNLLYNPKTIISMSAVGFYGDDSEKTYNEQTPPGIGFAHDICDLWEDVAKTFQEQGARLVIFRLGVVLGEGGGALKKMRPVYQLGLGGPIGKGEHWFTWIHIIDVLAAIEQAIVDDSFKGTYNLVAPDIIQQKHFAKAFAASLKRPCVFSFPAFILQLVLGNMATLLTKGPKVLPKRLEDSGFQFQFKTIEDALNDIVKRG